MIQNPIVRLGNISAGNYRVDSVLCFTHVV